MKVALRNNMDFLAGLLMLVIGAGAFYMALDFPFGSALRMGPGYFPRVLAGILMAFGLFVLARGLVTGERVKGRWGFKPLAFIVASLIGFGLTMEKFGFFPALVVLFILASLASTEFNWKEVPILMLVMGAFAWVVFIWLLGLPYPLVGGY
jgi:putative tricarboxylic transport membrane protein